MEHYDKNIPITKYTRNFKLTKKFKKYSDMLKDKPDLIPTFGVGGCNGCVERINMGGDTSYF
jgi:hypothetical protein